MSFLFDPTATTEIYTLSLHDALPILPIVRAGRVAAPTVEAGHLHRVVGVESHAVNRGRDGRELRARDRKSTRLNSSHANISYAVFCLKKKKNSESDAQDGTAAGKIQA